MNEWNVQSYNILFLVMYDQSFPGTVVKGLEYVVKDVMIID